MKSHARDVIVGRGVMGVGLLYRLASAILLHPIQQLLSL
jgi:glycine/D-amino acid oxidase-like deaminating enzyme